MTHLPAIDPVLDRAIGCFVGLAVGDALGTTLEGAQQNSTQCHAELTGGGPHQLNAGEWTDDTAMALCLADSIIAKKGRLKLYDLMTRFADWKDEGVNSCNGRCFDIGWTTAGSISQFLHDGNPIAGPIGEDSAGNGSIMRLAPAVLANLADIDAAVESARLQSLTTHGSLACVEACELMARILWGLINRPAGADPVLDIPVWRSRHPQVDEIARASWADKEAAEVNSNGYVVSTLEAALWAVDTTSSFEDALVRAVNLGRDADTVGAVTGQIAGAVYGYDDIPERWLEKLAWRPKLENRAASLFKLNRTPKRKFKPSRMLSL